MTFELPQFSPVGEVAELVATLPSNATGSDLRRFREAALMSRRRFAKLVGMSRANLRVYEDGDFPLSRALPMTRAAIALAIRKLGYRLTQDGWERLQQPSIGDL